ncbi:MAG: hypothetical protein LBL30_01050 [Holosporales bacterium]|jgi:hypothetical protein|nr:hypothetical protein [Holosporales bacterium]
MSLRKPTADENKELKELQEKYPSKIDRYLDVDTVLVWKLPYLMLGIDVEECNGRDFKPSLIKEADEIIDSAVLSDKLELHKREIVGSKRDPMRCEYNPCLSPLTINKLRSDTELALFQPHEVVYKLFRIIDVINWLDGEREIDKGFPLSLPEELVKHHKKKYEQSKLVQCKLDNYDQIAEASKSAKERVGELEEANSKLEADNKELKEEMSEKDTLLKEKDSEIKRLQEQLDNKSTPTQDNLICFWADYFLNNKNSSSVDRPTRRITNNANEFFENSKNSIELKEDSVRRVLRKAQKHNPTDSLMFVTEHCKKAAES